MNPFAIVEEDCSVIWIRENVSVRMSEMEELFNID